MVKSARRCSPTPSLRYAKRVMEQWALHSLCIIAFCFHTLRLIVLFFFSLMPSAHICLRGCLLDVSRLLGLTLRPSSLVCCCHRDS